MLRFLAAPVAFFAMSSLPAQAIPEPEMATCMAEMIEAADGLDTYFEANSVRRFCVCRISDVPRGIDLSDCPRISWVTSKQLKKLNYLASCENNNEESSDWITPGRYPY